MPVVEKDTKPGRDEELAALLQSLASWLDGMGHFIAVTKSEWEHASTGQHLMAQRLHRHTLKLRRDVESMSDKLDPEGRAGDVGEGR